MEKSLTSSEVCAAAGCPASTLRAWRNRNGLFPHHDSAGWTRFDLADAIGVRVMVILTERGLAAQAVANLVNQMRPNLEKAAEGYAPFIGVGRGEDGETLEFREMPWSGTVLDCLGWFTDSIVFVVDLRKVVSEVFAEIQTMREGE